MKFCEKASLSITRDIMEITYLQTSRNLKSFLQNSQSRFEKHVLSEISSETKNIIVCQPNGSKSNICNSYERTASDKSCMVFGIDNMTNLGHGIESVAFGISIKNENETIAICAPFINSIIYSETNNSVSCCGQDGLTRKIKINQSVNITFPSVVCSTDHPNHKVEDLLTKRNIHFISSGSILYDAHRVLQNKVDIAFYKPPCEEYMTFINSIINAAGGATCLINGSYVFGKESLVNAVAQNFNQ
jgi:hypothetical protein